MKSEIGNQNRRDFYQEHWIKYENEIGNNMEDFTKHYLSSRNAKSITKNKIYWEFQQRHEKESAVNIMKEILEFVNFYQKITTKNEKKQISKEIKKQLMVLRELNTITCYPYLLSVFKAEKEGIINKKHLDKIFKIIVNYCLRIILVGKTNGFNKLFPRLHTEIIYEAKRAEKDKTAQKNLLLKKYPDILKAVLLSKTGNLKYPRDDEFQKQLESIMNWSKEHVLPLLKGIIIHNTGPEAIIEGILLEHIMPQTLTAKWKSDLGSNWNQIHRDYLNALGNLTLTTSTTNPKGSNKPFRKKKENWLWKEFQWFK